MKMIRLVIAGIACILVTGCNEVAEADKVVRTVINTSHADYAETLVKMQGCADEDPSGAMCIGILSSRLPNAIQNETFGITIAAGLNSVAAQNRMVLREVLSDPVFGMPARTLCGVYDDLNLEFCQAIVGD